MKKRALSLLLAVLMLVTVLPVMASAANMTFNDVPTDAWFYADVKNAFEKDLINGKNATTFAPYDNLTYAEAVKLAAAMNQKFTTGSVTLQNGNPWYQSYVDYAKTAGIIDKDYNWNQAATRAGYMEIFAKALPDTALPAINSVPDGSIPDVPMSHPQAAAIYKLYRAGILQGSSDYVGGKLTEHLCKPADNIRRCEVAAILTRMMDASKRVTFSMGGEAAALVVTLPNAVSGLGGGTVKIDAGVAGGKAPYACQWQYSTDGANWTNGAAGTGVVSYTYTVANTPATQFVRLTVTDAAGKVVTSNTCTVTVGAALAVTTDKTGTVNVAEKGSLTVKATATGGKTPYAWQWQSSNDGSSWTNVPSGGNAADITATFNTVGTYYLRVQVTDADGKTAASAAITVKVASGLAVTIPATAAGKTSETLHIPATVTGGTAPYTYKWYFARKSDSAWQTSGDTDATYDPVFSEANAWQYWVRVTDKDGKTADSEVCNITVTAAATPLSVTLAAPTNATVGTPVNFTATVSGGKTPYTIEWHYAKESDSSWGSVKGTGTSFSATFPSAGTWQVLCDVYDADHTNVYKSAKVVVAAAEIPLSVSIPTSVSGTAGQHLSIPATVTGGKAPYTYKWYYARKTDSSWQSSGDSDGVYDPVFSEATIWQCWVRVTDANGKVAESDVCNINVTAAATPLSVSITAPSTVTANTPFSITASVTGGKAPYTIKWSYAKSTDSTWSYTGQTGTNFNFAFSTAGSWQVLCDVYDANNTNVYKSATITVSAASTSLSLSISGPSSATSGNNVSYTASISGGTAPYTIEWYYAKASDSYWGSIRSSSTSLSANFPDAGTWDVMCDVTDKDGQHVYKTIKVTVSAGLSVTVNPSYKNIKKNEGVTISASVSGGSGSYKYAWYINGSSTSSSSNSYYYLSGSAVTTYSVRCVVTDTSTGKTGEAVSTIVVTF